MTTSPTAPRMEKRHALYTAVSAAVVAFSLAFVWPAYTPMRVLWYYPLEHRWSYDIEARGLAMDWYGRCVLAAVVALALSAVTYAIARRLRPITARGLGLWAAWAATALVLSMSFYACQLAQRRPAPEPLPAWYEPR